MFCLHDHFQDFYLYLVFSLSLSLFSLDVCTALPSLRWSVVSKVTAIPNCQQHNSHSPIVSAMSRVGAGSVVQG